MTKLAWHAFEAGEVKNAREVDGEPAQRVRHGASLREEALVGGVVFRSFGQVGPLVRRLVR